VGLGASIAATNVHYHLMVDPTYTSFCDVSGSVSCTQVYMSRYSTVRGVPVALIGGIWFVAAGLLAVMAMTGTAHARESAPGYLFAASTLGLAVVLYFEYVSFVVLKAICLLCLSMAAAIAILFFLSGTTTPFAMTTLPKRFGRDLRDLAASPATIVVVVLFLGGAAAALALFPREGSATTVSTPLSQPPASEPVEARQSEFEGYLTSSPRVDLGIPAEGAKVIIVKFNDFQCPPCRQSHMAYKPILARYLAERPGAVRYVLKDFPLDAECNVNVTNTIHPAACEAAVAVRLARARGRGDDMIDWIFANQPSLTPELVRQAAHDVGGVTDYDAKYAATLNFVREDVALGKRFGVSATPTFFINGLKINGAWPVQYFQQAIEYELQHAK
jgi:uncharacterized membrane protein/predicted DsbA family dithiol-disulfide isomerase